MPIPTFLYLPQTKLRRRICGLRFTTVEQLHVPTGTALISTTPRQQLAAQLTVHCMSGADSVEPQT